MNPNLEGTIKYALLKIDNSQAELYDIDEMFEESFELETNEDLVDKCKDINSRVYSIYDELNQIYDELYQIYNSKEYD